MWDNRIGKFFRVLFVHTHRPPLEAEKWNKKLSFLYLHFIKGVKARLVKCGFLEKSFIINAPLVSCPFLVITFGWVQQQTHS